MFAARPALLATALVVTALTLSSAATTPTLAAPRTDEASASDEDVEETERQPTTIVVKWPKRRGSVHRQILGTNYHYSHSSARIWNKDTHRPVRAVVSGIRRAGMELIRYPGGTSANLFDWKKSIGDNRECQIDARADKHGFRPFRQGAYGLDEHMRLTSAGGAGATMMVPFVNETPADAAAWVEYMNTKAGPGNPNGGVDWADRRAANGHRAPYNIRRWEIGNEQRLPRQRYWMSGNIDTALRQYANGARPHIDNEPMGKNCAHLKRGARSDGSPDQVFDVLYPPIKPGSAEVTVNGGKWRQVGNLQAARPGQRVFKLHPRSGQVVFGNRAHGQIPKKGARVKASYTSVRPGVFSFIRAMERVDRSIDVCPSWGTGAFVPAARGRKFDCFTSHAYTNFAGDGNRAWKNAVEGHDRMMLGTDFERNFIRGLSERLPRGVQLPLSEFGTIWGDSRVFPSWPASMSHTLYMATQWVNWTELGVPWATGGALTTGNRRGVLGPPPKFVFSAGAAARRVVGPLFDAGGRRVSAHVFSNPARETGIKHQSYPALKVMATKGRDRDLYLLVINRMPQTRGDVNVRIDLAGFESRGKALVRTVRGRTFKSWNRPNHPPSVSLRTYNRGIARSHFTQRFAAHSVTVLHIPRAR